MNKLDYYEVLHACLDITKKFYEDDLEEEIPESGDYLRGIVRGLEIAIDKLESSKFLTEK